jgi:hypothetical protein
MTKTNVQLSSGDSPFRAACPNRTAAGFATAYTRRACRRLAVGNGAGKLGELAIVDV